MPTTVALGTLVAGVAVDLRGGNDAPRAWPTAPIRSTVLERPDSRRGGTVMTPSPSAPRMPSSTNIDLGAGNDVLTLTNGTTT